MRQLANVNFTLALLCLVYCGINMTLIFVNYVNSHYEGEEKDAPVSPIMFHLVEFWATFCFAILECISLISTPKALRTIYNDPLMLKLILFFNIVASFVPALLVTMNLELFEVVSHEIDYSKLFMTCLAAMVALVQLGCYNLMGRTSDGDMRGEVLAHYCEFIFEIISSLIAFFFCLENKFIADKEIGFILYGTHNDGLGCHICHDQSIQFEQTYFLPPHNSNYHHHQKGLDHTAARLQRQGDNQQAQSSSVLPHHSTYGSLG
ncbi:expressed unknown protein [Seminavis robusta]|uniref:Uncharacterized protein n=1 Tax=Seminavis robusta TaxID=568900 RepID=A0A9N8DL44_9STRA|nr:expressed unknown protein [Seminavis robusta]|eukprot:Sro183_g079660.1 n/a (263) ;mRNA; f:47722-48669